MKTIEETALLTIREGDFIRHVSDRDGQLIDIQLAPNGVDDTSIIAVLTIKFPNGNTLSATSDKFTPIPKEYYCEKIYK